MVCAESASLKTANIFFHCEFIFVNKLLDLDNNRKKITYSDKVIGLFHSVTVKLIIIMDMVSFWTHRQ